MVITGLMFSAILNISMITGGSKNDDDDMLMSIYMEQGDLPPPRSYISISSFLDFSWASWGKDTTQFETLLPPSEIDFTIDKRLTWGEPDKCDDILLFMPYYKSQHGQGSQLNTYLMAATLATFTGKALVVLEPPRNANKYPSGSQFGCPVDAFEDEEYEHVKEDFPDGLLRLVKHPDWISHGCAVPTCGGTHGYHKWEELMREASQYSNLGQTKEFECVEGKRNIKVIPLEGHGVINLFKKVYKGQMLSRATPAAKENAYNWATRLGARHRDATHFSNLTKEYQIWDYLTALINRSGLLRWQPWIARDVAKYIRSSNLPLDVSYDAIHVRRGDKLIGEAKKDVNRYYKSLGFSAGEAHLNYVPFSHYIEQAWPRDSCPKKANGAVKKTRRPKRIVYVATDDPQKVHEEIAQYPVVKGGVSVLNECTKAVFIFSPMTEEEGHSLRSFHISPCRKKLCPEDNCFKRYDRNIAAIADLMILTKSAKFVGEFNSNWGRLIRNFRTVLNDNSNPYAESDEDEPPVFVRDTVVAFGPNHPGPVGS
jgi:hypothetical protein